MVNNQNIIKEVTKYIEVPVDIVIHTTRANSKKMSIPSGYSHCIYLYSDDNDRIESQRVVTGYCVTYNVSNSNCFYVYALGDSTLYYRTSYDNYIYIKNGYIVNNTDSLIFMTCKYTCFLW